MCKQGYRALHYIAFMNNLDFLMPDALLHFIQGDGFEV